MWRCVAPALAAGLASAAAQRCGRGVALDAGDSKAPWRQRVAGAQVTSRLRPAPGGVAQAPRLRLLTALEAARQGPCARVPRRAWAARACTDARLLRAPVVPACARPGGRRAHRGGAGSEPCSGALRLGNSGSRTPCCFELRCVMMCLRPDLYWGRQAWGGSTKSGLGVAETESGSTTFRPPSRVWPDWTKSKMCVRPISGPNLGRMGWAEFGPGSAKLRPGSTKSGRCADPGRLDWLLASIGRAR